MTLTFGSLQVTLYRIYRDHGRTQGPFGVDVEVDWRTRQVGFGAQVVAADGALVGFSFTTDLVEPSEDDDK